jgi:hypothetical protein
MGTTVKNPEMSELWNLLKTSTASEESIIGLSKQMNVAEKVLTASFSVLKKVACSGSYEDFVNYFESRELPALKLTPSEMEVVKGGVVFPDINKIIKLIDWKKISPPQ